MSPSPPAPTSHRPEGAPGFPRRETPTASARSVALEALLVGLGWVLLALIRLPSVTLHPLTRLWGHPDTDLPTAPWTLWHTAWHLRHELSLGLHTRVVGFPEGGAFWPMSPLEAVAFAPLTALAGPVLTHSLIQLLHLGMSGALLHALARRMGASRAAALAVTPLLALSPVLLCSAHNGNPEVSQLFWLPAVALACWETFRRPSRGRVLLAAALLAAALLSNTYVGISTTVVAAGTALLWGRDAWRPTVKVALLAGLAALPLLALGFDLSASDASLVDREAAVVFQQRILEGQASLLGFVLPGVVPARGEDCLPTGFLNGWSTGTVAAVLACVAWLRRARRPRLALAALAVAGLLLALGPSLILHRDPVLIAGHRIPLPYLLLDPIPPFGGLIELWRFAMITHLAVALLVVLALERWPRWIVLSLGGCMLGEALLLNPGPAPWRGAELPAPALAELTEGIEPGAVLHLPLRLDLWPLYWQTVHQQPIGATTERPWDAEVFAVAAAPSWTLEDLRRVASARGYRWIVLHRGPEMAALLPVDSIVAALEEADLTYRSVGDLSLLDLRHPGPWPTLPLTMIDRPAPDPNSRQAQPPPDVWQRCGIDPGR